MYASLKAAVALVFFAGFSFLAPLSATAQPVPSIRRVQVLRSSSQVEIEIEATERIVPQTNLLSNPDRLVVDFVNARPSAQLRSITLNREEVKNLRVGLFSSDPPVTRIVLDLNGPQPYQIFPAGKTIMVKIGRAGLRSAVLNSTSSPVLVNANYPAPPVKSFAPTRAVKPGLEVSFQDGLLSINSTKANLSEILFAVHERTGAEIEIPAGAEQDQVAANFGPGPAAEVLAHLLNGSKFNFMILNSATDPQGLDRVILSPRTQAAVSTGPAPAQVQPALDEDGEAQSQTPGPSPIPSAEDRNAPTTSLEPRPSDSAVPD
jgi:hypothetical protein